MNETEKVVIDKDREPRSPSGIWAGIAIGIFILLILFLLLGGANLFTGVKSNTPAPTTPAPTSSVSPGSNTGQ